MTIRSQLLAARRLLRECGHCLDEARFAGVNPVSAAKLAKRVVEFLKVKP